MKAFIHWVEDNIKSRAGFEPTPLAFRPRVLTITPLSLPDVIALSMPTCLCGPLPER